MVFVEKFLATAILQIDLAEDGDQLQQLPEPSGKRLSLYEHNFDRFDFGGAQSTRVNGYRARLVKPGYKELISGS
jgi:hypothetical protein